MNKDKRALIKKIGHDAVILDWVKAFDGKSYGNRHLFRVNKIAKYLIAREGGDEFVVLVGAWVHDVALATGSDYDPVRVEIETQKFIDAYKDIPQDIRKKIVECAVGHESNGGELNKEASIVHDADAIDKCGALGVIRHIWKMTNMIESRLLSGDADFNKLKEHLHERQTNLITSTARDLVKELNTRGNIFFDNKERSIATMEKISSLAMIGKTTDKIVKILLRDVKNNWVEALKDQVDCRYLTG